MNGDSLDFKEAWAKLRAQGYVVLNDSDPLFGCEKLHEGLCQAYFNNEVLAPERPDVTPSDRDRARDVVDYSWRGTELFLEESATISITTAPGLVGNHLHGVEREYERVWALKDTMFEGFIRTILTLVPPELRYAESSLALNLFRTYNDVVTGPHRDGARFVAVYVVGKVGEGAETTLHPADRPDEVALRMTLEPGQMVFFDDERFLHDVSPLTGHGRRRDAIVGMVYYPPA